MRTCFVTDLHGDLALYDQLTSLVRSEKPRLVILGGDMHADCDEADPLGTQVAFIERDLASMIDGWRRATPGLQVVCVAGNHDMACGYAALEAQQRVGRLILLDHQQPRELAGRWWLGFSHTPPTPYWAKDLERLDEPGDPLPQYEGAVWDATTGRIRAVKADEHYPQHPSLAEELATAPLMPDPWIFVCHPPPYHTKLDRLPYVDGPVGSRAVRAFVERRRPFFALHGHCHESPDMTGTYQDWLGPTLCVNPGQSPDRLYAVLFDTDDPAGTLRHTVLGPPPRATGSQPGAAVLQPPPAHARRGENLVLLGYRGSGKTSVGRRVASRLGWEFIDTDELIERATNRSIRAIFEMGGEVAFRALESRAIHDAAQGVRRVIGTGGGVVLSAENRARIRRAGVCIWLTATPDELHRRLSADPCSASQRPPLTESPGLVEVRQMLSIREPLYRDLADHVVETTGRSVEEVAGEVIRLLARPANRAGKP